MTTQTAARRIRPAWTGWAVGVPMNLALGVVGYYPMVFLWLLGVAVVQGWGWVSYDPTLVDDGFSPIVLGVVVLWLVYLPIVIGLNHLVTRATAVRRTPYRSAAALLVLTPFAWELVTSA